jgi:hypothetical protein
MTSATFSNNIIIYSDNSYTHIDKIISQVMPRIG